MLSGPVSVSTASRRSLWRGTRKRDSRDDDDDDDGFGAIGLEILPVC